MMRCTCRHCHKVLLQLAACLFTCLVLFSLFNFNSRIRYEMPTVFTDPVFTNTDGSRCRIELNALGLVELNILDIPQLSEIEARHTDIKAGGRWSPTHCNAWQKVAIIIAYRDRYEHLRLLLDRLHAMLPKQMIYYQIFVVEQFGDDSFNKGRLYNVGVVESLKRDTFDCFIFHDVDMLPEHDANLYYCDEHAHHLSPAVDEMRYHVMYYNLMGGVVAINRRNVYLANGHSNEYWGWGNEDDDFTARTEAIGLLITRPPEYIGRYKMIRHAKRQREYDGNDMFMTWRARWRTDGLNSLDETMYKVVQVTDSKLFTNITVDVGTAPTKKPDYSQLPHESVVWFLRFYFP